MSQIENNKFLEIALEQVPRLLGQLNRNPSSRSYGSFDRAYWHYRTNDISCARYQEAILTLALLYCCDFEGNDYYRDEKILEWVRASLRFTVGLQRRNGSVDEWYINEGSYVATAFLAVAIGKVLLLFRANKISFSEEAIVVNFLEKTAEFLANNKETTVMNQVSGAILALATVGYLCNKKGFLTFADELLTEFLSKQNQEGWWSEYGGPDIGYLSLTVNYLEKYIKLTGSDRVVNSILKAKTFIQTFINPDLTAGGEYMSRNTEYIIPSTSLPYLGAVRPVNLDDRYLCYILYNWIETGLEIEPQTIEFNAGEDYFSNSSLLRVINNCYFLVVNGAKGGSFRLYIGGHVYYDSGLEITFETKKFSTGVLDSANEVIFQSGELKISGFAKVIKEPLMKTRIAIIFKLWQLVLGRVSFAQRLTKKILRPLMISYSSHSSIGFKRIFQYQFNKVIVTDIVSGVAKNDIMFGVKASYSAVPSSKYAPVPEIDHRLLSPEIEEKEENGAYIIERIFSFGQ